jgi:hypothetical protein
MPLAFLLDEHLRGPLWQAIVRHNARGQGPLDVVRVGDAPDLPLGSSDAEVIVWAERASRILVSRDCRTLPVHLQSHLQGGRHSPGIILVPREFKVRVLVESLELIAYTSDSSEFSDAISYLP